MVGGWRSGFVLEPHCGKVLLLLSFKDLESDILRLQE